MSAVCEHDASSARRGTAGESQSHPVFILPFLFCDVFRPPSLPPPVVFFFGLLALGMNPLTEFLGHFRLNGFYGITGNRFIPPAPLQLSYHSLWYRRNILSFSCVSFDIHACLCVFYALMVWPQRSVHRSTGRMWSSFDTHLS